MTRPFALCALAAGVLAGHSAAYAQATTTSESGYEITRRQTRSPAPAGKVGWKTTDHERRVGNTDATRGKSYNADLTVGGFVDKCPTFEGKVPGEFEVMLNAAQVDAAGSEPTQYAKLATARIVAHLNDNATIRELEMEGNYVSVIDGIRSGVPPFRRKFKLGQAGEPDMDALIEAASVTGDLTIAALMWIASEIYHSARFGWLPPNECVEFSFDPPTKTRSLGPSASADVKTELRTKSGSVPVGGAELRAGAIGNIGSVAPRQGETQAEVPVTFTYTASAKPKKGHGFEVSSLSRAGFAAAKWQIDDRMKFEGTFSQTESQPQRSSAGFGSVEILETTTITGKLVWSPESEKLEGEGLPNLPTFGDVPSTFYVPTDGEISVEFEHDAKGAYGTCRFTGSKIFPLAGFSPRALRYMLLEVAEDGRYKISLGMVAGALPTPVTNHGCHWSSLPLDVDGIWKAAAIVIGRHNGELSEDRIAGQLSPPIVVGPSTTTGSWSFSQVGK